MTRYDERPARSPIRAELDAISAAVAAAHDADVEEAMGRVRWERRGVLRRLVRSN
jgi:hypothetical protein